MTWWTKRIIRHFPSTPNSEPLCYNSFTMNRGCMRSLVFSLGFALVAMTFMIATVTHCSSEKSSTFAQGPFCSVEHTSATHAGNSAPEMILIQELAIIATGFVLMLWSKRISLKILTQRIGRIRPIRRMRGRPTALQIFLPQIFASHGN